MKHILIITLFVLMLALPCYANEAPVFSGPIPNIELEVDEEYSLNLSEYFTDPDSDRLIFRSSTPSNLNLSVIGPMFTITPRAGWEGVALITFNANDSEFTAESNEVQITVGSPEAEPEEEAPAEEISPLPANRPPLLIDVNPSESPYQMTTAGDTFFLTVMDFDGNDLTFMWMLDGEVIPDAASETFTYNNAEVGTHSLIAVVSDGIEDISYSWTLRVAEAEAAAQPAGPVCPDGSCDETEDCLTCEADCGCAEGQVCEQGICIAEKNYILLYIIIGIGVLCVIVLSYALARHFSKKKAKKQEAAKKGEVKPEDLAFSPSTPTAKPSEAKPAAKPVPKLKGPPPTQFSMEKAIVQESVKKSTSSNQLQGYVAKMRKLGYENQTIAEKLKEHGWKDAVIKQALKGK